MKKEKSDYYYNGKYSDGEVKLRRDTLETLEEVTSYLDSIGLSYDIKDGAHMLWIYVPHLDWMRKYAYFWTTGRWNQYKADTFPKKHYHCNGIKDFIERFAKYKVTEKEVEENETIES